MATPLRLIISLVSSSLFISLSLLVIRGRLVLKEDSVLDMEWVAHVVHNRMGELYWMQT